MHPVAAIVRIDDNDITYFYESGCPASHNPWPTAISTRWSRAPCESPWKTRF